MGKQTKIYFRGILDLIITNNIYNRLAFLFDYETNRIYYQNKEFKSKRAALLIKEKYGQYEFNLKDFYDVIYHLATMNTPEPEKELDLLSEIINEWLIEKDYSQIRVITIITELLKGSYKDLSQRYLETRVGTCLRELGWIRKRNEKFAYWIKPS